MPRGPHAAHRPGATRAVRGTRRRGRSGCRSRIVRSDGSPWADTTYSAARSAAAVRHLLHTLPNAVPAYALDCTELEFELLGRYGCSISEALSVCPEAAMWGGGGGRAGYRRNNSTSTILVCSWRVAWKTGLGAFAVALRVPRPGCRPKRDLCIITQPAPFPTPLPLRRPSATLGCVFLEHAGERYVCTLQADAAWRAFAEAVYCLSQVRGVRVVLLDAPTSRPPPPSEQMERIFPWVFLIVVKGRRRQPAHGAAACTACKAAVGQW